MKRIRKIVRRPQAITHAQKRGVDEIKRLLQSSGSRILSDDDRSFVVEKGGMIYGVRDDQLFMRESLREYAAYLHDLLSKSCSEFLP